MVAKMAGREARTGACKHEGSSVTVNFGLERKVCPRCGGISVRSIAPSEPGVLFQDWEQARSLVEGTWKSQVHHLEEAS